MTELKVRAARERVSIKAIIERLVDRYLKGKP